MVTSPERGGTASVRSLVIAGGGTAGHIEPALALADAFRRHDPTVRVTALGTAKGLESDLVPARGYDLELIPPVPMPRRPSRDHLSLPLRVSRAVTASAEVLGRVEADVLVGFGGYVSLPAYLAARRVGVPFVVHEANARPGLANRVGARLTRYVAVSSQPSRLPRGRLTGLPLRSAIASLDRAAVRASARQVFGLEPDRTTLLVFGGSQGAERINRAVSQAAPSLLAAGVQVLHAAGPAQHVTVDRQPDDPPYALVPYLDRMDLAYAAADLALCRSGAMTCAELAAVGLPGVFVPYPWSNGEQELNAAPLVRAGGAMVVDDSTLTSTTIEQVVLPLLLDPDRLRAMAERVTSQGHRDADERLRDLAMEAARSR